MRLNHPDPMDRILSLLILLLLGLMFIIFLLNPNAGKRMSNAAADNDFCFDTFTEQIID